jgi:hypothetical protein
MAARTATSHPARMMDIRRALPAIPLGISTGVYATYMLAARGVPPVVSAVGGGAALGGAFVALYRAAAGWPERARRQVGYVTSVLLGLVGGAVLVFAAFGASLCGIWGETCSPDELALINRLLVGAMVAVVGVPTGYAVVDLVTLRRR